MFRIPPPYLWTPLSPQRVKGCSPLTSPKKKSKPKNASRFAKRIFLCFSHLRLRRRFHVSAGHYRQQRGNTSCKAANRRNEKKVQQRRPPPVAETGRSCWGRGQQNASGSEADAGYRNPSGPARRNRWWFSGSLLTSKENISLNEKTLCPAPPARKAFQKPFLVLFWRAKENLTPLSSKTPAAPSPSPPAHFRGD